MCSLEYASHATLREDILDAYIPTKEPTLPNMFFLGGNKIKENHLKAKQRCHFPLATVARSSVSLRVACFSGRVINLYTDWFNSLNSHYRNADGGLEPRPRFRRKKNINAL